MLKFNGIFSRPESMPTENIAQFIQKQIIHPGQVSLGDIIRVIQSDDEWSGWWEYHSDDWNRNGWKPKDMIFVEDIPLLFNDKRLEISAKKYNEILNITTHKHSKINANGDYVWFSGASAVANICSKQKALWASLYDQLQKDPCVREYFNLLPYETWHMTIIPLYTLDHFHEKNKAWYSEIEQKKPFLNSIEEALKTIGALTIKTKKVYTVGIFLLSVTLDKENEKKIAGIAQAYDLESTADHHISLAYQFKPAPISTLLALEKKYQKIITDLFAIQDICLNAPQAYLFESMDTFETYRPVAQDKSKSFFSDKAASTFQPVSESLKQSPKT